MAETHVRLIKDTNETELQAITDALIDAFGGRFFLGAVGGDKALSRRLLRIHVDTALADDAGMVFVVENAEDGILGAAIWFGPGGEFLATEKQKQAGWYDLMGRLNQECRDWWDYFLREYGEYTTRVFGPGTKLDGYHLQVFGVASRFQRKGLGAKLINTVEALAKRDNACVCLETVGDSAVPIYRSLGFEVKTPFQLRMVGTETTYPLYGFIKWPATA